MDMWDYEAFLRSKGIKAKGSGWYGTVYQHPTHKDVVVKVWDSTDYGYESWVKFCLKSADNPLVPKIYHHSKHGEFNITMLEKLKPLDEVDPWSTSFCNTAWNKHLSSHFDFEPTTKFCCVLELKAKHEHAKQILKFLKRSTYKDDTALDLHDENVMWRGKGKKRQLVITDPLVVESRQILQNACQGLPDI